MKSKNRRPDEIDLDQSLQVIREMIEVSRNNLKNDGILFILWGWIFFISVFTRYLIRVIVINENIASLINKTLLVVLLAGVVLSVNYIYSKRLELKTYTGEILRYLWGGIIFLNLFLLLFQLQSDVNFDMLISQYMLMLALGTFVTGGIIRFRLLIYCSISFMVLVLIGLYLHSDISVLVFSLSFITGLAVPGHILYSKRER